MYSVNTFSVTGTAVCAKLDFSPSCASLCDATQESQFVQQPRED